MIRLLYAVILIVAASIPDAGAASATRVSFKTSSGGGQVAFGRKGGTKDGADFIKVSLNEVIVERDPSTGLPTGRRIHKPVRALITGPDAEVCSLLYPVAVMGRGRDAAFADLQAQGYVCTITDAGSQDCDDDVPADQCMELANQLSQNIDAALGLADQADRAAFQAGTEALGFAKCPTTTTTTNTTITVSTTATTGTASTTTTTATASTTTTNPMFCGLVPNGAAGVCGGSCPPGQTCLMNAPAGSNCSCFPDDRLCGLSGCGTGRCPVQYERCEPAAVPAGCACCTPTGDPCSAASTCCSGEACDIGTGTCPATSTTTTAPPPTTTSTTAPSTTTTTATTSTTTTTIPCGLVPNGAAGVCGGSCPPGRSCLMNAPAGNNCSCVSDQQACSPSNCNGACPVQFERCQPGCACCTPTGDPCSAATTCCSGQACNAGGTCP